MRLVIDMQGAQSEFSAGRGVGRYIINLAKELIKISDKDFEIYLALNGKLKCNKIFQEFEKLIPRSNIKIWNYKPYIKPSCKTNNIDIKEEELFREWFLHQFNADFIWVPNFQEGYGEANIATSAKLTKGNEVIVSTLHDVIPLIYESDYLQNYQVKTWYLKKIKYVEESDIILTVSNYSKNKISELLKIDENKIYVVYNGYDQETFFVDKKYKTFDSKEKYFLYVGGADQHKNLYRLIESFSKLDNDVQQEYKLYIAGKEPYNEKNKLLNHALNFDLNIDNIKFLGFVSDNELRVLMQRCACFVFPSLEEGFGLPPLEAMACGAPVIASKASSIAEIVKYEPALFDPFSTDDIAKKMYKAISNSDYANDLIKNGIKRAENFLWRKSAENLKAIFLNNIRNNGNKSLNSYSKYDLINDLNSLNKRRSLKEKSEIAYSIEESTIFSKITRLYIDVSAVVLEDYVTGIQRTVIKLATNLKKLFHLNKNVEVKAIFSDPSLKNFYHAEFNDYKFIKSDNLTGTNIVEFYDGDILILADLHPSNIEHKVKFLKNLTKRGIKVISILYDIIPIEYPIFFDSQFVEEYKIYLRNIAKFSGIIAISKATMNSYIDWCREENIKFSPYFFIDYFYLGADIQKLNSNNYIPQNSKFLIERMKSFPSLLMVGTIEPRKQHDKVLNAVEELWNKGIEINLIFVGREGWKTESVIDKINSHKENGKRLFWLSGISDEYLNIIYEYSSLVVLASLEEGYGLPIIEAAHYNKPLLLRDISVFREVAEDNAFYFTDDSKEYLSEIILNSLNLIEQHKNPLSSNIKFLTWEESAKSLIKKILPNMSI